MGIKSNLKVRNIGVMLQVDQKDNMHQTKDSVLS